MLFKIVLGAVVPVGRELLLNANSSLQHLSICTVAVATSTTVGIQVNPSLANFMQGTAFVEQSPGITEWVDCYCAERCKQ